MRDLLREGSSSFEPIWFEVDFRKKLHWAGALSWTTGGPADPESTNAECSWKSLLICKMDIQISIEDFERQPFPRKASLKRTIKARCEFHILVVLCIMLVR